MSKQQQLPHASGFSMYHRFGQTGFLLPTDVLAAHVAQCRLAEAEAEAERASAAQAIADAATECLEPVLETEDIQQVRVPVFDKQAVEKARTARDHEDDERARRIIPLLNDMLVGEGQRRLIERPLPDIMRDFELLGEQMPNFKPVIEILSAELALAMADEPSEFRVSCLCLDGVPGIGKTRFACKIAEILDVGFDQVSLGAAQGSFELMGVAAGWSNTRPGRISKLLAEGEAACPVVLLDEMDKLGFDDRFPTLPVLLDLLERDTARRFRDESLELRMDASKIIFLATSNAAQSIPEPLKSRIRLVEIAMPNPAQRRSIIGRMASEFQRLDIHFEADVLDALAEIEMDLRMLSRYIRELAGKTLANGENEVKTVVLPKTAKQRMGFVS